MMTQEELVEQIKSIESGKEKRTVTIQVPTEIVEEMERISYEKNAREHVIDRLFEKHQNDTDGSIVDSEPFKHFMTELAGVLAEEDIMMNRISTEIVPENLQSHDLQWSLDYLTGKMTITIMCDCEIAEL